MSDAGHERPWYILPVIVLSQFAGTSLWFAGNAVIGDLQSQWALGADAVGHAVSAVQLGFILGTLLFAFLSIADRYSPRRVFFVCSLLGAAANIAVLFAGVGLHALLVSRFLTGFFLAGIYPVGMRIAAGWYKTGLGHAIGLLVGALVLGTAFPHLLKAAAYRLPWEEITIAVSAVAALGGGLMLWLVPDGPHITRAASFDPKSFAVIFRSRAFRASAFGYFGHMWELYAFWAFVPIVLAAHAKAAGTGLHVPLWSFIVIGAGAIGCAAGGIISLRKGSAPVAFAQLMTSGICCAISPVMFHAPQAFFLAFLLVWGIAVVGDSPQFSTLNAQNAPPGLVGSALTIANCIGFAVSIVSIQLLNALNGSIDEAYLYLPLVIGPLFGLAAMLPLVRRAPAPA